MALSPRLEVRQAQSLTLTPQLMQSIRLLQLSHLELSAFVEAELLSNPLLERGESESEGTASPGAPEEGPDAPDAIASPEAIADQLDTAVENVFPEEGGARLEGRLSSGAEPADIDQYVASVRTLADHLGDQIALLLADPADRLIAAHLLDGLDPSGYLTIDPTAVAELLGAAPERVTGVLKTLQGCEPTGVFARSVRECLALQLAERDRLDPMMARLLDHLDLVAGHDMAGLCRAVGCDRDDLMDMLVELRALDPRPGRAYDAGPVELVVPDVFVRQRPDGSWHVELNSDVLPRVLVDRVYYATVSRQARDAKERSFLSECLATANWLTKSLDQRAQTMLKVATEIVRQQDGFLVHGIAHLRPMTLRMVAEAIQMHELTVSRVTASKYLATPRGLLEMKYFFTTAIAASDGGGEHSAEAVRHRIRQLIEAEPPGGVLSDDTLAEILKRESGMDVARRTVAKYREAMHIPSSVIRRRQKKALERT